MGDLPQDMQGSKNPLILRNYRVIAPAGWKHINLVPGNGGISLGPGPTYTNDFQLTFKIEAAPVILTYESELIFRIYVPFLNLDNAMVDGYPKPTMNQDDNVFFSMVRSGLLSGIATRGALYRTKFKSASQMVKRAWCTMSNMTFQSVNTPQYLNEILLRKPIEDQRKKPDNYTGEYSLYRALPPPLITGMEIAPEFQRRPIGVPVGEQLGNQQLPPYQDEGLGISLGEHGTGWSQWDNISFSTPYWDPGMSELVIDFRIPLTELLPVFKIGVIPMMMIGSPTIDLIVDLYHPRNWFISRYFQSPQRAECWLNISTVSFPDINPLAAMLLEPRLMGDRFIVPYLDYFTLEHTYEVFRDTRTDFVFNVLQFFRNVPFISLSFLDETSPAFSDPRLFNGGISNLDNPLSVNGIASYPVATQAYRRGNVEANGERLMEEQRVEFVRVGPGFDQNGNALPDPGVALEPNGVILRLNNNRVGFQGGWTAEYPTSDMADYCWGLTIQDRQIGGFYNIPPNIEVTDLKVMLGESAFPLTQLPIDTNSMYMYNRKHFEMYGRNYNSTRVCPLSREKQGDATYFFDISHGPYSGFTIDADSPLQIVGSFVNNNPRNFRIRVILTIWYSNSFNVLRSSGGVLPLQ